MGPLIDAALEKVDRRHAQLTQLSSDLVDALNLYHTLMREPPHPTSSSYTLPKMPPHINPYQFQTQGPPPPHVSINTHGAKEVCPYYHYSINILST